MRQNRRGGKGKPYARYSNYGPGGRNCPCCGPAPKDRKKFDRTVKRREKRISMSFHLAEIYR